MNVAQLIAGSLRLLGVYGAGDDPAAEDLADGLLALNELINNWNAQHLTVYTIVQRTLTLTPTVGTYTIGIGGTLGGGSVPRPVKIESAGILNALGLRQDLKIDTSAEFANIAEPGVTGRLPLRMYCDYDFPIATIRFWPIPSVVVSLDLRAWDELSDSLALVETIDLPPAYLKAIRYNLALSLAPEYGKDPGPVVMGIAQQSKQELFGLNASTMAGTQDPPQQAA